jgi:PPOX class probable F420-dependent enzyme
MPPMNTDEAYAFILERPRTAKLATVRKDGRPHVIPVWVDVDDERRIVFNAGEESLHLKAMRREPRVSLCLDDDTPPFAFVTIAGTAELVDDLTVVRDWAARLGGRYMGADQADAYGERNGVPGEYLIRVTPDRITGFRDIAL